MSALLSGADLVNSPPHVGKVPGADIANGVSIRLLSRRKQIPRARDTLEIERATLRKFQSGPRDQIGHDARYKYLIWA